MRSLSSHHDQDKQRDALKTFRDGLHMAIDGLYEWACMRLDDQAHAQGETSTRIVREIEPAPMLSEKRELSVKELAALWGVSERSIYQWKTTGGLKFKKMGRLLRFDPIEADLWARRHQESFTHARLRVVK